MECIELKWLCEDIKKVRSSQAFISINFCTKLGGIQLLRSQLGGRGPSKCERMQTGVGRASHQCEYLQIIFFNSAPSP